MTTQLATGMIVAIILIGLLLTQTTAGQLSTTQTISSSGTIKALIASAITLVQGPAQGKTGIASGTFTVTLGTAPTSGNTLILCYASSGSPSATISSISQTGVTWARAIAVIYDGDVEIWYAPLGASAGTTITITIAGGSSNCRSIADVCEWSGLSLTPLDQTASNPGSDGTPSSTGDTGTIGITLQANELLIGTICAGLGNPNMVAQSSPTNGFTLLDGSQQYLNGGYVSDGYLYKIVTADSRADAGDTFAGSVYWTGCIATFYASSQPPATVTVTPSNIIGTNNLTLGTQLSFYDMKTFPTDSQGQTLINDAGIKLVRLFDGDLDAIGTPLVLGWNEASHTGTYNWTVVNPVIQAIYASGAQPLIVLMSNMASSAVDKTSVFTNGMAYDNALGGLPSPQDAASYAASWVTQMKTMGYPVVYYEIGNEINTWLFNSGDTGTWTTLNSAGDTLAGYFATDYNASVTAMKAINSAVSVSYDFAWSSAMMSWWLADYTGTPLDRIDYHDYTIGTVGQENNVELFGTVQTLTNTGGGTGFGSGSNPILAQQMYYDAKGVTLPLFDTESNLDYQWTPNTDPIIVQMTGAVWLALSLKTQILNNVKTNIYYAWQASLRYQQSLSPPSYGFGLIDSDNHQPWYPYYVYKMIGNNLQVGDSIVSSINSGSVFGLAWIDNGNLNILLINTFNGTVSTTVSGATGNFNYEKIDNTYSFLNAQLQTGSISLSSPIAMNGYTVILLTSTPTPPA